MAALPPITSNALYSVEINFDGLKDFPESLTLSLPNDEEFTIGLTRFLHRSGYLFRIDEDPPGTPPVRPNPNAELSDFSYSWQGTNDEYDVLLTVNKGILIGLIAGNEKRYTIKLDQESESTYIMSDVRPEGFRPMDPHTGESEPLNYEFNPELIEEDSYLTNYKTFDVDPNSSLRGSSNSIVIDAMVVWTEEARVGAGGLVGDPNDTNDIETLMIESIDRTNMALTNSLSNTVITKFHTAKLTNLTVSNSYSGAFTTRDNFRNLTEINDMRDDVGADLVMGIITDDFYFCGIAYVQSKPGCDANSQGTCGVGTLFNPYAYALVSYDCQIDNDAFVHELGHLLGGNHVRNTTELTQDWIDDVSINYPYAFARKLGSFTSIMSADFSTRRLNFSNPDVTVNGIATGVEGFSDNHRIFEDFSTVMSGFRTRPDLIFHDDFE